MQPCNGNCVFAGCWDDESSDDGTEGHDSDSHYHAKLLKHLKQRPTALYQRVTPSSFKAIWNMSESSRAYVRSMQISTQALRGGKHRRGQMMFGGRSRFSVGRMHGGVTSTAVPSTTAIPMLSPTLKRLLLTKLPVFLGLCETEAEAAASQDLQEKASRCIVRVYARYFFKAPGDKGLTYNLSQLLPSKTLLAWSQTETNKLIKRMKEVRGY